MYKRTQRILPSLILTATLSLVMLLFGCDLFFNEVVSAEISVESTIVAKNSIVRFDSGKSGLVWSMEDIRYEWLILAKPVESTVDGETGISNKYGKQASFVPDATGTYQIGLRVTVGAHTAEANASVLVKEVPSVPGSLSVTSTSSSTLTVAWTADTWATSYEVLRYPSLESDAEGVVAYRGTETTFIDGSLSSGTHYRYRVCAINELGKSQLSAPVTGATMVGIGEVPGAPAGLEASAITSNSISLRWSTIAGVTYNLYRSVSETSPVYDLVATGIDGDTYSDYSRESGTLYWYKLSGSNTVGTGDSSEAIGVKTLSIPPDSLTITAGSPATSVLTLSWSASPGATGYHVYRSGNQEGPYTFVAEVLGLTYSDTGLEDNTTYYYRIKAMNESGESQFSITKYRKTQIETRLTVISDPSEGGSVSGSGIYPAGSTQTITATANSGWEFIGWNDAQPNAVRDVVLAAGENIYTANFRRVLFADGFESSNWDMEESEFAGHWSIVNDEFQPQYQWGRTSNNVEYGNYAISTNGDEDAYAHNIQIVLGKTVELSSFSGAELTFEYWMNTEAGYDKFFVEGIQGGIKTTLVNGIHGTSNGWLSRTVSLDAFCGNQVELVFRFASDSTGRPESPSGIWLDDIKVTAY